MSPKPLSDVLAYEHPGLLWKFRDTIAVSEDEAALLFRELKTWLWLRAKALDDHASGRLPAEIRFVVTPPLLALDEMWHCFLLFTADYAAFCRDQLGVFVHHEPNVFTPREPGPERDRVHADVQERLRVQAAYAIEQLGEATVRRWYFELPQQFPKERLARLHKLARLAL